MSVLKGFQGCVLMASYVPPKIARNNFIVIPYYMPYPLFSILLAKCNLMNIATLWSRCYYYLHLIDEKNEV